MNYQIAYDIEQVWYPGWWLFGSGILIFSVGLATIVFADSKAFSWMVDRLPKQGMLMSIFICVFGSLLIGAGIINYSNFANLRQAARDGSVEIAEGKVEQFVPMPYEGHAQETFVVNGQYFALSDYDLTKGFNKTQSHGGPLKEGLQVRITHVDGSIVKLEIASNLDRQ